MEENLIETITAEFIKGIIKTSSGILKIGKDEIDSFFQKGVKRYISKQYSKFISVKTVLRGNTPVNFYDIYFPLSLEFNDINIVKNRSLSILDQNDKITIIGEAGSGKSMLIRHLFLRSIERKEKIPVCVELRYFKAGRNSFKAYLKEQLFEHDIVGSQEILERLLRSGKFVFYLDGFDEISGTNRHNIAKELYDFIEKYIKNQYILTSRPYTNIGILPLFLTIKLSKLTKADGDIDGFIDKQLKGEPELAYEIKKSIAENKGTYIESFLTNPLLLSLYILTYQSNSSIPEKKSIFYRRVLNALFSEHDSKTKIGYQREKRTGFSQDEFERALKLFSFITYFNGEFSFLRHDIYSNFEDIKKKVNIPEFKVDDFIYDMKVSAALWVEDGGYISFAHRSIQEYFCALLISKLDNQKKQLIYKKLSNRTRLLFKVGEMANFLSLCEEIDPEGVTRHYKIPILSELNSCFEDVSEKKAIENVLLYIYSDFKVELEAHRENTIRVRSARIEINQKFFRATYYVGKYIERIQRVVNGLDLKKIIEDAQIVSSIYPTSVIDFNLSEEPKLQHKIRASIIERGKHKCFQEMGNYISDELNKCFNYIEQIEKEECAIIDML